MIRYLILFDPCRTQDSQHRINFKIPISTQILLSRCFLNKRTLLTPPNVSIDPPGQHWVQSCWAEYRSSLLCPLAALPSSKKRVQQPVDLCAPMLWQVSCLQVVATQTPYLEKKKLLLSHASIQLQINSIQAEKKSMNQLSCNLLFFLLSLSSGFTSI